MLPLLGIRDDRAFVRLKVESSLHWEFLDLLQRLAPFGAKHTAAAQQALALVDCSGSRCMSQRLRNIEKPLS